MADELPPCFTSVDLTMDLAQKVVEEGDRRRGKGYDAVSFNVTRFDLVPRRLEIPHPYAYCALVLSLERNWDHLSHIQSNKKSALRPRVHDDGRVVSMDSPKKARLNRFGARYFVKADISHFYPSIYTHSLAWSLVGREVAKRDRASSFWFNQLDERYRHCRRNETTGVGVGPGTSAIAAEIVLASVDAELSNYKYARFIDDYQFYARDRVEAEQFLLDLAKALSKFNLSVNPRKTAIEQLPMPTTPNWIRQLQLFISVPEPRGTSSKNRLAQALDLLDLALDLTREDPDASSLKYALLSIESSLALLGDRSTDDLVDKLLELSFHRPVAIPFLCRLAVARPNYVLDRAREINRLIANHASGGRADAVSWLIYLAILQNIQLRKTALRSVIEMRDCLSIVLLAESGQSPARAHAMSFAQEIAKNPPDDFALDAFWLLFYQLEKSGELSDVYTRNETFQILLNAGVNFVDMKSGIASVLTTKKMKRRGRGSGGGPYRNT